MRTTGGTRPHPIGEDAREREDLLVLRRAYTGLARMREGAGCGETPALAWLWCSAATPSRAAPSSGVDVVGGRCLIDIGSVQLSLAPLAGRASVVAAKRGGKGVRRGVAGVFGDLRKRQLASA
jgi:hypothetical protein